MEEDYRAGGELLTSTGDIIGRWKEDLLNPTDTTSTEEVEVGTLRWTCPSPMLKSLSIAWRSGTVPLEWQTGVVVPLFKKGTRESVPTTGGSHFSAPLGRSTPGYWRENSDLIVEPRIQEEQCGFRISTSKSEAMVLDRKRVACPLRVGGQVLPQVEEFKYVRGLVHELGKDGV
ncbi:hypothetical protein L3Q82_024241 [Scortum barcoo]|uniref:Uncharacterized protein n=1 Tax=Scortum barcoo TaxID=214431 RepID=A0ACB8WWL6_9TELE|nr:hypothetical protein L3Q82_024241 [Scortum barcoo]